MLLFSGGLFYAGYALSDDAMAMVASVPDARRETARRAAGFRFRSQAPSSRQKAANELQKAADETSARGIRCPRASSGSRSKSRPSTSAAT